MAGRPMFTSADYARPFAPAGEIIPHRPARTDGPGFRVVCTEDVRAPDRRSSATTEMRTAALHLVPRSCACARQREDG
jgi:hypothetical protein